MLATQGDVATMWLAVALAVLLLTLSRGDR